MWGVSRIWKSNEYFNGLIDRPRHNFRCWSTSRMMEKTLEALTVYVCVMCLWANTKRTRDKWIDKEKEARLVWPKQEFVRYWILKWYSCCVLLIENFYRKSSSFSVVGVVLFVVLFPKKWRDFLSKPKASNRCNTYMFFLVLIFYNAD